MKTLLALATAALMTSAASFAASPPSPVFQIRSVLDAPTGDSEPMRLVSKNREEVLNVQKTVLLDQTALKSAKAQTDTLGHPHIEVTFTAEGQKRFAAVTRQNLGQRLAIVIDGQLYCAPRIMAEITGGRAEITGDFTLREAKALATKMSQTVAK